MVDRREILIFKMSVFVSLILIVFVFVIYILQNIYQMLRQNAYVKNLPRVPISICLPMLRSNKKTADIYQYVNGVLNEYDGMAKLWMGSRLVVICDDPVNIRTILMSKDCLDKPYLYRMVTSLGNGLFTGQSKFRMFDFRCSFEFKVWTK